MAREYLEILCPICGRGMGEKATRRFKKYGHSTIVLEKEDYLDFMLDNYDLNKKIAIIKGTGKAGFKNFRRIDFKDLPLEKKDKLKRLILVAIKNCFNKQIITRKDLELL